MMTGKSSLPKDRKVTSRLSHIKGKEEREIGNFLGERDYVWTTDFYSNAKGRRLTNSSHHDLLFLYKILLYAIAQ